MATDIKELEARLTELLGKKSYIRKNNRYKGKSFYSLHFEDESSVLISTGMKNYKYNLLKITSEFEYYRLHKAELEIWIKSILKHDNFAADWQKLPILEFIGTRIDDNDQFVVFDYYMCISEEQKIRLTYKETCLSYYCKGCETGNYKDETKSFIYKY